MSNHWTTENIPDLTGKVYIVTGGNSGLGYESILALAEKNATVIMASRNQQKANDAVAQIKQTVMDADVRVMPLDLADLDSVRQFANDFNTNYDRLDALINNAGLMAVPQGTTADGFETQFGVNHLGHFALTGLLLEMLLNTPNSRVVNVSSDLHRRGNMHFDDLNMTEDYQPWAAYGQSKLANILFTLGLQKRLNDAHASTIAVAAHPGYADTELQGRTGNGIIDWLMKNVANRFMAQSAEQGALPQLYAAIADDAEAGAYYGPHKGMTGYPQKQTPTDAAQNEADAETLWQKSVEMTGITYDMVSPVGTIA